MRLLEQTACLRLGVGLALALVGCAEEDSTPKRHEQRLRNAETPDCETLTSERLDGIGLLETPVGRCTATLIGPQAIVTAAHCFEYTTASRYEMHGERNFELDPWNQCGRNRKVEIRRWLSMGRRGDGSPTDIAVALLEEPIAEEGGVRHFQLASSSPLTDSQVTLYGRGLTDDPWQDMWWREALRRVRVNYDYGNPNAEWVTRTLRQVPAGTGALESGDSGGPGLTSSNFIFVVHSKVWENQYGTIDSEHFGNVVPAMLDSALPAVVSAFSEGRSWPDPDGNSGWPCADGETTFCDQGKPGYLRTCQDTRDVWASHRVYCPAGCENGACIPTGCEGLGGSTCTGSCATFEVCANCNSTACEGSVFRCLPADLYEDLVCPTVWGQELGPPSTQGG